MSERLPALPAPADPAPRWVPSPLLLGQEQTPRFLRADWDAKQAHDFGPWRVAPATDPSRQPDEPAGIAQGQDTSLPALAELSDVAADEAPALPPDTAALTAPVVEASGITAQALADATLQAHARGVAEGRAQAQAEWEADRAREGELLRHLVIELRALQDNPGRLFEPLHRLSLHLAEQLVRGELRASGAAIAQIVRQSLAAMDAPADAAARMVVSLHPDDAAQLESMKAEFLTGLTLQPDAQLSRGSVRLRLDDTLLEDFIEHRLADLAERLLVDPGAHAAAVTRLRDTTPAQAVSSGFRPRAGGLPDIIDATALPVPDAAPNDPDSQAPQ